LTHTHTEHDIITSKLSPEITEHILHLVAAQPGVRAIRNLAAATQACKAFQQAAGGLAALALRAIAQDQHDDLRVTTKPVMSHFGSHEFILYWIQLIDEEGRRRYDRPGWLTCTRGRLPRPSWMSAP